MTTNTSSPYQYSSIDRLWKDDTSTTGTGDHQTPLSALKPQQSNFSRKNLMIASIAVLGALTLLAAMDTLHQTTTTSPPIMAMKHHYNRQTTSQSTTAVAMPSGVNVGSWLSLEDYFFAGQDGAVETATPDTMSSAICLPPLYTGRQSNAPKSWHSETDLLTSLIDTVGVARAIKIFHAHRTSFIVESDVAQLARLGVQHIRVPLSWCFTNADPSRIDLTNTSRAYQQELLDQFTCPDPFYQDQQQVRWPAIPKSVLTQFLRHCGTYGLTASLDLHTYPGATSPGTFSGMWPRPPRFWYHDQPEHMDTDLGRRLFREFVAWVEDLATTDPLAFDGILAISPMNEPAHLAGVFRHSERDYLPPLAPSMAAEYRHDVLKDSVPDGPHLRVFRWIDDAIQVFRESSLPKAGKELHVNVHESALSAEVLSDPHDDKDMGGRHPSATNLIAAWWSHVTSHKERQSWAVLDMHHYHAWEPACMGTSDGPPLGNYTCSNVDARVDALARCTSWADVFREAVDTHCGKDAKLMSGEFSTSTHHKVLHACNDVDTLRASYDAQLEASQRANVKLYYWSYRMPFGGAFRSAWSFSHLMYRFGVNPHPDESLFPCGDQTAHHPNEVTDDFFAGSSTQESSSTR